MTETQSEQAGAASRLSVEAKVFIPVSPEMNDGSPACSDIPEYMTNCYPFVQTDPYAQNAAQWPNQQPQSGRGRGRGHMRGAPAGHYTSYASPYGNFQPQFSISPVIAPAAPYQPVLEPPYPMNMNLAPPQIGQPTPFTNAQGVFDGGQAFLAALNQSSEPQKRGQWNSNRGGGSRSNSRGSRGGRRNKNNNNKSADNPGKVSVGIQNEVSGPGGGNNKKKQRKRIIILLDIAIQTDFNDEIANLTLAERPNSLFQIKTKQRARRKASNIPTNTSTDSEEEVDSDSGYSSPLHRRNLTSSGTHPVNSLLSIVPSPSSDSTQQGAFSISPATKDKIFKNQTSLLLEIPAGGPPGGNNVQYVNPVTIVPSSAGISNYNSALSAGDASAYGKMSYASAIKAPPVVKVGTNSSANNNVTQVGAENDNDLTKKKRKRKRNRKRKKKNGLEDDENTEDTNTQNPDISKSTKQDQPESEFHSANPRASFDALTTETAPLHFEDENEFPGLGPAAGTEPIRALTYSDILQTTRWPYVSPVVQKAWQMNDEEKAAWRTAQYAENAKSADDQGSDDSGEGDKSASAKENKIARKRRKRREMANIAAERELMEISLEQQFLKEIGPKATKATPPQNTGKKSKQPIALNIAEMISALENTKTKKPEPAKKEKVPEVKKTEYETILNVLDGAAPQMKRGKERENPKLKKPSTLKKVILKEREEKKKARLFEDPEMVNPDYTGIPMGEDFSQEGMSSKTSDMFTPASNDMSPISQNSPISMSPLSPGSPLSSGVNSPIAGGLNLTKSSAALKLHSRRFREYCNQVIDKDIDDCCTLLLQDLVRFQDRLYHKDPVKAKSKRRIVLGLREVAKHLKLKKIKFVIISPNMERVKAKGGLDDALNNIIHMCTEQEVPFVFALGRRALGRACAKLVPVSVAGVFNYEGSEENFHKLMELTKDARQQYAKMVKEMEAEEVHHLKNLCNQPVYAHMGHSRTPSGCSGISFASSLLSEPISENDNDYDVRKVDDKSPSLLAPKDRRQYLTHSRNSSLGKVSIAESIDEGNEADTEELNDAMLKHMNIILDKDDPLNSKIDSKIDLVNSGKLDGESGDVKQDTLKVKSGSLSCFKEDTGGATEEFDDNDNDTVEELPHIDSIHNLCGLDNNTEMLSQHSEVLSTHSSKTLGATTPIKGSTTPVDHHSDPELTPLSLTQRIKSLDKERIESWVEEAKTCIQDLKISESDSELTVGEGTDVDS
ncbi:selenocysteine insertion sequence-binding protein 2-like isoform X2 [Lineus longissimus]|uniref:selenocysteine insertion sequence-binding protein 2-like isoform X2 n=1 Tax=Lineus longissimus TaxID=88925 RepID=UPI002B4E6262